MTPVEMAVEAARRGDRAAFAELVREYRNMAFGYALSILGDYHAAEDATQEAFVSAYFGLATMRDAAAFPQWLRGIVRNQCFRLTRGHRPSLVSLDQARELSSATMGPEEHAVRAETRVSVLRAVLALPDAQREIALLYYIGDYSQREIARFLGLPVTTVNNRLHAARQRLKGGLLPMVKDDLHRHALPEAFAEKVGTIIAVRGPVVEAQFEPGSTPEVLDAVALEDRVALAVMQQLAEGRVRCIAFAESPGIKKDMQLTDAGAVVRQAVSPEVLREAAAILVRPAGTATGIAETGIKALDLLCPLPAAGTFALYGPPSAGKLVLLGELLYRLTGGPEIVLLNFVQTDAPERMCPPGGESLPNAAGPIETFYLPVDDAADPSSRALATVHDALQGAAYMSRAMAQEGLYPAIDPLVSWSRLLRRDVVGEEHIQVAEWVREVLHRFHAQRSQPEGARPAGDRTTQAIAERLRAYLTQPFYTGEQYTKVPGESVPAARTVHDCREILTGRYNDIPLEAFRFTGSLDQSIPME